jgi:hypothetical protein
MCDKFVTAVEKSSNSKTGEVSATYAPIHSCPKTCPFLDSGCYAQSGHTSWTLNRLNKNCEIKKKTRPIDIAREEAKQIKGLSGTRDLRLHIVGDAKTPKAAEILSRAAKSHTAKAGKKVWTYTHAWREIPREKFGEISVLASCETLDECKQAIKRGYAASVVRLKPFKGTMPFQGLNMKACPGIVQDNVKCNDCKLCLDDSKLLKENKVICFFPHGSGANKAMDAIREVDPACK